ncbi:MAG: type II toxin-antitoxin system VapC family toxin [Rickettsiaceae bacterium]|nr:type II toxin-antitoxin system VapC family toxin [Rickettsiaceae bacterium]
MKAVFDTNIIIDYLNGEEKSRKEIEMYNHKYISIITYIEVLVGVLDEANEVIVKNFLASFHMINIEREIADFATILRKQYRLKIPDALILASAQKIGAILVTRNTKDLSHDIPIVRIPYEI